MCKICDQKRKSDTNAKEGDLRIWWCPQVPTAKGVEHFSVPVKNPPIGAGQRMADCMQGEYIFDFNKEN